MADENASLEHWAKMRDYWAHMEEETQAFRQRLIQMRREVSFVAKDWTPSGDVDPLPKHLAELERWIGQYHLLAARAAAQLHKDTSRQA